MNLGKGWRTFALAVLVVIAGGIEAIDDPTDLRAWATIGVGAVIAGLRAITTTAPGKS